MKNKLSTGGIYICVGVAFLILNVCFNIIVFYNTNNSIIRITAIAFSLLMLLLGIVLVILLRSRIRNFSDSLSVCLDDIVNEKENITFDMESETLAGKFNYKLKRLYEIMQNGRLQVQKEKQSIQEIISDISHQVIMPVTNLKMYNSTILDRQISPEKEREFNELIALQIEKLEFLIQAMVKMSRLETDVISLYISPEPVYNTVGNALAGIELLAEKKHIEVIVNCDPKLIVPHDKKWTAEALFNILDNAVKYTPSNGKILISVKRLETVTQIDIADNGKGIPEQHFAQIFKRFYREDDVHDINGVGIGLYLCREIVTKQNGYIQVRSEVNKGSTFSVFLSNERQL